MQATAKLRAAACVRDIKESCLRKASRISTANSIFLIDSSALKSSKSRSKRLLYKPCVFSAHNTSRHETKYTIARCGSTLSESSANRKLVRRCNSSVTMRSSATQMKIWCQRRDSNSQTPVSKTGRYSNSRTLALWRTGMDLNLRVLQGEPGLQPGRFSRAHAPVQSWRKVDESNAHGSSPCHGFRNQLPAIQQYLPQWRRVRESNPLASCESLGLQRVPSRQVPYRPAHSPINCQRTQLPQPHATAARAGDPG